MPTVGYGYESRFTSEARSRRRWLASHALAGGDRPPVHAARAEGRAGSGSVRRRSAVGVRPHAVPRRRKRGERDSRHPAARRREPSLVCATGGHERGLGGVRAPRWPAAPLRRVRDTRLAASQRDDDAAWRRRRGVPRAPLRAAGATEAGAPAALSLNEIGRDRNTAPQDWSARAAADAVGRRRLRSSDRGVVVSLQRVADSGRR